MDWRALTKWIAPLAQRVQSMITRGLIRTLREEGGLIVLGGALLADEELGNMELFQHFGLASAPPAGGEMVVLCVGGDRNHAIVVATEDRRCRPKGLAEGDVVVYSRADSPGPEEELPEGQAGLHRLELIADGRQINLYADQVVVRAAGEVRLEGAGKVSLQSEAEVELRAGTSLALVAPVIYFGRTGPEYVLADGDGRKVAMLHVDCARVTDGSSQGDWPLKPECGDQA